MQLHPAPIPPEPPFWATATPEERAERFHQWVQSQKDGPNLPDAQGNCVLTEAEAERNRAIEAEYRAAQLAERLRAAGLDPDM
ncbi:MAG TPA: hypothetical protein V6C91_06160 [Coleofasciculaceae cyanobacterium]